MAAKVTRDAWIEGWVFEELEGKDEREEDETESTQRWDGEFGSGYPAGSFTVLW